MKGKNNRFFVQKHAASHLHYDFRLEINGVLKSWAVPKGPSPMINDKRLAIEVDDHDISYGDFEGVLPAGSYGAGRVMLWDKGTYKSIKEERVEESFEKGRIEIEMKGEKMKGKYAIIRIKPRKGERGKPWLLFKMSGDENDNKKYHNEDKSVKSGKRIEEIR